MATYLVLTNKVLRELNEVELTSANFSSSRGVQTATKDFVNKSINDIYNQVWELPNLYKSTTQDTNAGQRVYSLPSSASPQSGDLAFRNVDWDSFRLVPKELVTNGEFTSNISSWTNATTGAVGGGTPAYNSDGNGRARLNDAALSQSISTTKNKTYRIQVRVFDSSSGGSRLAIKVGTSAHNTTNLSTTLTVSNYGESKALDTTFDATVATTYVTIINSDANNLDVDYVRISESIPVKKLRYLTYDDWNQRFAENDLTNSSDAQGTPNYVYPTQNKEFGLSSVPDTDRYSISYEYWKLHTELSAHGDSPDLATQYQDIIVNRAKYYLYKLRSDVPAANIANAEFEEGTKRMRLDLIEKSSYMRDARVNLY